MSKYGFEDDSWEAAKTEVKGILIARAKAGGTISYSELAEKTTSIDIEDHDDRFFHLLGEISIEENTAGRGMLSVIVIHKSGDMRPGTGFFELAKTLGRDTSDNMACWIKEFNTVLAYWQT